SPTLDMTGEPVPVAMAQRLFCDCKITPVLLDEHGDVLRVGRSKRTFTAAQRKAIARRDGGCAFPTCDRHPNWCDGHHLVPWYLGGRTEIENGALLCRKHHLLVHDDGWRLVRDPATGLFDAVPP
ncbi:MAG: HNH endonuclease signature motif containing protein, partial [Candidatus Dormiibacterota bacterium]